MAVIELAPRSLLSHRASAALILDGETLVLIGLTLTQNSLYGKWLSSCHSSPLKVSASDLTPRCFRCAHPAPRGIRTRASHYLRSLEPEVAELLMAAHVDPLTAHLAVAAFTEAVGAVGRAQYGGEAARTHTLWPLP